MDLLQYLLSDTVWLL